MGTGFVTNLLVNTALNKTAKIAENMTAKEVQTQKGGLGFVGKIWDKVVKCINEK